MSRQFSATMFERLKRRMNGIEEAIIRSGLDGELPLTAIDDYGAQVEHDPAIRKRLILDAVRTLLSLRYIVMGRFEESADRITVWNDFTGSVDEQLNWLQATYAPEVDDWESWGFLCWFALTAEGQAAAESIATGS